MSDIKSMFAKMATTNDTGGGGDNGETSPPPKPKPKPKPKQTIEETYQKKSQLEHILLRPDTYIGSVEKVEENMWVYDSDKELIVQKNISYVPGLYKIFDEILVNAADNKQRDNTMDCIKIEINQEDNIISVWNNGQGIPVAMHKNENMYVPTMIFGHLLTSSNYNDKEEKVTGGRNGYGAKLCNIFSTKFTVETATKEYKRHFKQVWGNNMTKASEPKIKDFFGEDFTKITFSPDLAKFKMEKLEDDIVSLMCRRAYDVAASTRGVKVFLNGKRVPVKNFKDYVDFFTKGNDDDGNEKAKVIYEVCNERWEVAMTLSDRGFQQMSFVNSIATTKGGRHVDYVTDMIVKQIIEVLKKRNKGGITIKPFQVKNHMWIFINCLIVNPTFDSQTKENMTLQAKSFGSKCTLSEKFISQIVKSGIVESVLTWAKFKAQTELEKKTAGKKQSKLKGIPKLEDANEAGTKNGLRCTLILTEGDSAKSLAVSGLGVIGRDYYGVFPLRGKLLNVREATHKQILENAEINNLIKILGLQYKKKYNTDEDMRTLRYGKVMIMTDQDQDGSHIKGLLINFIHYNWPELLRRDFLEEFITPIVKAKKRNETLSFYSLPEFEEWKSNTPNHRTYQIKYYKGLGTSDSKEAKEYFSDMGRHRIRFRYKGPEDDDHIVLAFSKKHIEHRKEWLTNFMVESRRRKELGLSEKYLYTKDTKSVSYTDFVNLELVLFSNADNIRSIPCMVDGLKPGQRKVMFTCFKRNDKREVKVAQLAGSVAEMSAYHHGEVSLCMTIVNLAQNFVGSNNINLLEPRGQFGTRMAGGKDSASARYIFTKMSPLTRMIFNPADDNLLKHEFEDNQKIEPVWYIPIIPMVLVNGADGIGTGWMTKIPNYNPRELVKNIRVLLDQEDPTNLIPWYKNFTGTIVDCGDNRYVASGEISIIGDNKAEITELPVGTWTQNYKESVLEPLLHGSEKVKAVLQDYKEYNTDTTVKFIITFLPGQLETLENTEGLHKTFKLQSLISTSSMCVFDELGCIRRYDSVNDLLKDYFKIRLSMYQKRKDYLEGMLKAEASKLSNQARFIMEKCDRTLVVENKKRKVIIDELIKRGYEPDPVKDWKQRVNTEEEDEGPGEEEEQAQTTEQTAKKPVDPEKAFQNSTDVQKFDYLLGMSMWMLTEEKKNELLRQRDIKLQELETLKKKSHSDLWREDLDAFMEKLDEVEEKERNEEAGIKPKKTQTGRKKVNLAETMPSPVGKRIEPKISEDMKKRIQTAIKEKKKKMIKKESTIEEVEEKDEFDLYVQNKKTLKEKLGTPEEAEKKAKTKKAKDGLKQTKLNFKKKSPEPKLNGTPKKRGRKAKPTSSDEDDDGEFNSDIESPVMRERPATKRLAAKQIKYNLNSSDDDDDDGEVELYDNNAVIEPDTRQEKMNISSDSENESPPPRHETSEDMFDSLVGRTKKNDEPVPAQSETQKRKILSDSDSDMFVREEETKKTKPKKKKVEANNEGKKPKPGRKKKKSDDEDSSAKKTKGKGKKKKDDSDSDIEIDSSSPPPVKTSRAPRNIKQTKYVFDSDDSD
ncbi:DNA topoisomerase 2 [Tribolium madens]|uniref:DNA topoisomerase 2 n=1 Tax=Tribolium madens TaxID=41895 RepID=UPI001CF71F98|nr:DNA topoisomerase 2 [Tribolium madens]